VQRFCGKRCAWAATKGPAFNARISRETAGQRGDTQRGRGAALGYVKRGGRHEHRLVAESVLGRALRADEIVHHIDENKQNNSVENLRVLSQGEHMREHGLALPGVTPHWQPWLQRGKAK
jgi:hypothetical protein